METCELEWQWLMVLASAISLVIMAVVWFFLVPHPEDIGIYVEELTEKEALISSATEKKVFDKIIRNSISAPEEV